MAPQSRCLGPGRRRCAAKIDFQGELYPPARCWSAPPTPGAEAVDSPRAHSLAGGPATRLICPTRRFRAGQPVLGPPVALVVSVRRAAPSLAPHLMQSSRAGSAPLQEVPEPHQSSPSHRPYQPRLQGGRDNQIDAAGRECTSRSNFTAIMVVHVQRRLWPPLSGVGCDNSPTGVRDGGYDPPWVRRHAHPPQQAPGGSGRRRSRHRFIGHVTGSSPGGGDMAAPVAAAVAQHHE